MNRRIKEIRVEGLFGMFDHVIPLNMDERLTVIYGENGIGKTMIFTLVDYLFKNSQRDLFKKPIDKLTIVFCNSEVLEMNIKEQKLWLKSMKNGQQKVEEWKEEAKIGGLFADIDYKGLSSELKETIKNVNTYFIDSQRLLLLNDNNNKFVNQAVVSYSKALSNKLYDKHLEYRKLSEELELSLGKRLLNKEVRTDISLKQLQYKVKNIENRQIELKSVGLLEGQETIEFELNHSIDDLSKAVIAVNIQDIETKLETFGEIYEKLRLLLDILNNRRFLYKKLSITESSGFVITNSKNQRLFPNQLSSGEQHELVLLYQLLFEVPENTLVLIDEPEISLHVAWQKEFLEDMKKIIALRNIDILIATHSPSIINGNWDLTVPLKGIEEYA